MPLEPGRAGERRQDAEARRHRASVGPEGRSERPAEVAGAAPRGAAQNATALQGDVPYPSSTSEMPE